MVRQSQDDLQQLISDCKANDRLAQKKLFELTSPKVMSTCKRYCFDQEQARDLFQESYIRIFKNIDQFNLTLGNLDAWVYTITKNVVFDYLKKNKIKFTELDSSVDMSEEEEEEEEFQNYDLDSQSLLDLIKQLPEGYRTILNMYVFEEMSHKEIADVLQIKESSSRSQYMRAKLSLKKIIENHISHQYEKTII
ncbi:MAG: sigma-70 family RNA polymerase sigma factor [Saprospiraceae bacterium]|nr:sigma-70 family RNA polymerase sigma factor [Saprospiraceae bacterium]